MDPLFQFFKDNKDALDVLLKILGWLFGSGILIALAAWIYRWWRLRNFRDDKFPFRVLKPNSQVISALLDVDPANDPLPASAVPYQIRVAGGNTQNDLDARFKESQWILILGRTGIGKSREAAELAQRLNRKGWTILNLTDTHLVGEPAVFPKDKIELERRLLFVLDDLNKKMWRGRAERPARPGDAAQQIQMPLQERLLRLLEKYEDFCGASEIRVIATARNETEREQTDEPSQWEKLEWERFPKFWKRFAVYTLPHPDIHAQANALKEATQIAQVKTELRDEEYTRLARTNDATFSNLVENIKTAKVENRAFTAQAFIPTLSGTWEERYARAIKKYPAARWVYDAVELLQITRFDLYDFTIEATARLIVGGNWFQRVRNRIPIYRATRYLLRAERIWNPRDGQIEAKPTRVDAAKYISANTGHAPLTNLVIKLANRHPRAMRGSLMSYGGVLYDRKQFSQAELLCRKAITLDPKLAEAHYNLGVLLADDATRVREAEAEYRAAMALDPKLAQAHNNLGLLLAKDATRVQEAEAEYRAAMALDPKGAGAHNNLGLLLADDATRVREAEAEYRAAMALDPKDAAAHNNLGLLLAKDATRAREAEAEYRAAMALDPKDAGAHYNLGALLAQDAARAQEAEAEYRAAIEYDPNNTSTYLHIMILLRQNDRAEESLPFVEKWMQLDPQNFGPPLALASIHKKYGRLSESAKFAAQARALIKPDDWYNLACLESVCGNVDAAVAHLRRAAQSDEFDRDLAKRDPDFEWIREDARFKEIVGNE